MRLFGSPAVTLIRCCYRPAGLRYVRRSPGCSFPVTVPLPFVPQLGWWLFTPYCGCGCSPLPLVYVCCPHTLLCAPRLHYHTRYGRRLVTFPFGYGCLHVPDALLFIRVVGPRLTPRYRLWLFDSRSATHLIWTLRDLVTVTF